jgi:hypothetical protein
VALLMVSAAHQEVIAWPAIEDVFAPGLKAS